MGIDVQGFTRRRPKKLLGQMSGPETLKLLEKTARDWAEAEALGPFFRAAHGEDGGLYIEIYPLADAIEFRAAGSGLNFGARTSNGGPGYHAAVIALMDAIAAKLGVAWEYGTQADCSDETGFALSRDFKDLQRHHADFFRSLMQLAADGIDNGSRQFAICLPMGLGSHMDEGIACPLGILKPEEPAEILDLPDADFNAAAAAFFPWWPRERNEAFWQNTLRGLLWIKAEWRPPHSDADALNADAIFHARDQLTALAATLPPDLAQACHDYEQALQAGPSPVSDGIGYRRRIISYNVYRGWWIDLPGTLAEEPTGDGAVQFFDDDTALRLNSFLIEAKPGSGEPVEWTEDFIELPGETLPNAELRLQPPPPPDEDGLVHQFAIAMHTFDGGASMLLCTMTYTTPEQGETMRSRLRTVHYKEIEYANAAGAVN